MKELVEPSDEAIRERAYEISQRANGGSPEENWRRAREELRDEAWQAAHEDASTNFTLGRVLNKPGHAPYDED